MEKIFNYLDEMFPNAYCELNYNKDYELLIAIVLSAQTTDKKVNKVTKVLFEKYKTLKELNEAKIEDIESIIKEIGTSKKKSVYIKEIVSSLIEEQNGIVPNNREYLESLKGVGRKTANVFLSEYYKVQAIAVDTHVERITKRLNIAPSNANVKEVENILMKKVPKERWIKTHHQLIFFGRYHCKSQKPNCQECKLKNICKYYKEHNKLLTNKEIIHTIGENIDYIQFKKLLKYKEINHAYTLKNKNIYFGPKFNTQQYMNNYKHITNELNIDLNTVVRPNQNHTSNVTVLEYKQEKNPEFNPSSLTDIDGLITNKKQITLATTNADCILFLIYDPINKVIANIHSGWRGTLNNIITNTLTKMHNVYNCNYEDIICCICPSIRKCHFEVNKDVKDLFYNKYNHLENINSIIEKNKNKYHIDTILLNKTLMLNLGLKKENIIDSGICSVCNYKHINSYRHDKENFKLSTAIIQLK